MEALVRGEGLKEFIKSSRVGGKAILHRGVPMADSWCWSTGMVIGEALLPSQRVVKGGDGKAVLPSCIRWQLSSGLSAMVGEIPVSSLVALRCSCWVLCHESQRVRLF